MNAETLAHVALIARHGAAWYRSIGTARHPGSRLVTIGGAVARPGVIEAANGTNLEAVVRAAGGLSEPVQAFLLGGYAAAGPVPTASPCRSRRRSSGAVAGRSAPGLVYALPESVCPVAEVARVAAGSPARARPVRALHVRLAAIAGALEELCRPGSDAHAQAFEHVHRWCRQVAGRGACAMPDGAARFVTSALRVFAADFDDHARHGACEACSDRPELPVPAFGLERAA